MNLMNFIYGFPSLIRTEKSYTSCDFKVYFFLNDVII